MKPLWSVTIALCKGDDEVDKLDISDTNLDEIIESIERWLEALNTLKES